MRTALGERVLAGDPRAMARAISTIENEEPAAVDLLREIFPRTGRAYLIGVTGPPGAGKSTLIDRLVAALRARPWTGSGRTDEKDSLMVSSSNHERPTVGVIAVDPTSPFTGGAVLGDRIRMQTHTLDPDVFIRSMATRGSLGGLARATGDVIKLMDAFGFPWIIIETVGVGQTELDIIRQVDTTVVALVPESGDSIQAMKAGLMEVADVFVVNKADRDGAHALMAELRFSVHLHYTSGGGPKDVDWEVPILAAQAANDVGIDEVMAQVQRHRAVLEQAGALETRRRARRRAELEALLVEEFTTQVTARVQTDPALGATIDAVTAGRLDPYSAVAQILSETLRWP
jgi:LAO/AO transport system kinase